MVVNESAKDYELKLLVESNLIITPGTPIFELVKTTIMTSCDYGYSDFQRIRRLVRVGLFTAVFLVLEIVSKFLVNPLNGYHVSLRIIWYAFILLSSSSDRLTRLVFALVAPFFSLVVGFSGINPLQIFTEYFLAYYLMIVLLLFREQSTFLIRHRLIRTIWLILLVTLAFSLNFLMHFLAGIIWWTPNNYWGAAVINFTYIIPIYAIAVPLLTIIFR